MGSIFFELTLVLCLASLLAIIFKLLRQPPILAYILAGIIIGPFGQLQLGSGDFLGAMGEFGITLLLFMLGLEMRLREFKQVGKTVFLVGLGQIILTQILGYSLSLALGFSQISAFYISIALTFSSTVIIVKLISDKKDLASLYGKISIGLLLIQDFFAILILILLSGVSSAAISIGNPLQLVSISSFGIVLLKGVILFSGVIFLSKAILPRFMDAIAKSQETLFLFSIAWVFGLAALVSSKPIGFSVEIGGFLAGIALANSSENFQIIARMKALRDFFVTIFFVFLGMKMVFGNLAGLVLALLVLSIFAILLKPLIVLAFMGLMGYRKRTSFLTGLNFAQISEFSLIIIFLGNKLGHISNEIVFLVTGVGIITFITSTYTILNANSLFRLLTNHLAFFERKNAKRENLGSKTEEISDLTHHVVLVGAQEMGQSILDALQDLGDKVVVVDFDPAVVSDLKEKKVASIFGDIADLDIQARVNLDKAQLVISTIPDLEDNLFLIKELNRNNRRAKIIVMAKEVDDAKVLYKAGADYVVLPHLSGGQHVAKILKEDKLDSIEKLKSKDMSYLS